MLNSAKRGYIVTLTSSVLPKSKKRLIIRNRESIDISSRDEGEVKFTVSKRRCLEL